ncbi:S1 RNA-binding domain-containing protein [Streptomyces sp. NPDC052114]|uniref:S1 RNA-binding domain-containing protein n=1 Tax=unclassified Streptomyces TaxID=2593676 RepID=UPI003417B69A
MSRPYDLPHLPADDGPEPTLAGLARGDVCRGTVTALAPFGAFVDVRGTRGLVRLPEITDGHIDRPEDALRAGQEVTARVLLVDPERGQLVLSLKEWPQGTAP